MNFMKLDEFKGLKGERLLRKESKWIVKHRDLVRTSLNTIRNEIGGQIRKEYTERVGKPVKDKSKKWVPDWHSGKLTNKQRTAIAANVGKGDPADWEEVPTITNLRPTMELCVPTLQDIQDCIEREPHLMETDKGRAIFDDFVDAWLCKTAGKPNWDVNKRHYETVSKAKRLGGASCIDEGMEAMCFLFFENQHYRHAGLSLQKQGETKYSKKQSSTSPWTCSDGGQLPWGGWRKEGQARWKVMRKKVEDSRKRPHVEQMEAECLARLRAKHNLDGGSGAASGPPAAKRARFAPAVDSDNEVLG